MSVIIVVMVVLDFDFKLILTLQNGTYTLQLTVYII